MGGDRLDNHPASAPSDADTGEAPRTLEDEMKRVLAFFELLLQETRADVIFRLGQPSGWPKRMASALVLAWRLSLFMDRMRPS